jgi:hypothetical protein
MHGRFARTDDPAAQSLPHSMFAMLCFTQIAVSTCVGSGLGYTRRSTWLALLESLECATSANEDPQGTRAAGLLRWSPERVMLVRMSNPKSILCRTLGPGSGGDAES